MVFGFLAGIAGFLGLAFLGGFGEGNAAQAAVHEPQFANATERLEKYQCRAMETKMVIMGGIEDGFDASGDEPAEPPQSLLNFLGTFNDDQVRYRTRYDDPVQNRYFSDQFAIPSRTFRGMVALRLEDLSKVKNDGISIGYFDNKFFAPAMNENAYSADLSLIFTGPPWQQVGDYVYADLDHLPLIEIEKSSEGTDKVVGYSHKTVLDVIRENQAKNLVVMIADDTIIDFIGFALCLEPAEATGTVFDRHHHSGKDATTIMGENIISLYSKNPTNGGQISCQESRPLPCINDRNLPAPAQFNAYSSIVWSGGEIKFTAPVRGDKFASEDDVNKFCRDNFGDNWRAANAKDGAWLGTIFAYGKYPEGHNDFWITHKDGPHHNCWSQRRDYADITRLEANK